MKAKRLIASLMAGALCLSVLSSGLLAGSNYCQRQLSNGNQCGKSMYWANAGQSIKYNASHKYGGFLGMFTKTCNYQYYYKYWNHQCGSGHIDNHSADRYEIGHDCGK